MFSFILRMCLVRLKAEGKDGRYMYKTLVRMMWLDVEERIDNLGVSLRYCADDYFYILGISRS